MIIGFAAIGAAIIEQQLNMATAASKGAGEHRQRSPAFLGTGAASTCRSSAS